jgi:hypothetical protein
MPMKNVMLMMLLASKDATRARRQKVAPAIRNSCDEIRYVSDDAAGSDGYDGSEVRRGEDTPCSRDCRYGLIDLGY